ncbi:hypothetical protein MnTg02_02101 [bacterium MnTg02]|nr:hypothetical protein MnTg02_02101 [bacterium MnTg02]
MNLSRPVHGAGLHQYIFGLTVMGAAIHTQRTANGTGNSAIKGETGNACIRRRARHLNIRHRRAGAKVCILVHTHGAKSPAEANNNTGNAAIAHQEI